MLTRFAWGLNMKLYTLFDTFKYSVANILFGFVGWPGSAQIGPSSEEESNTKPFDCLFCSFTRHGKKSQQSGGNQPALKHDLAHDKPEGEACIGARCGAQQTMKKNTP